MYLSEVDVELEANRVSVTTGRLDFIQNSSLPSRESYGLFTDNLLCLDSNLFWLKKKYQLHCFLVNTNFIFNQDVKKSVENIPKVNNWRKPYLKCEIHLKLPQNCYYRAAIIKTDKKSYLILYLPIGSCVLSYYPVNKLDISYAILSLTIYIWT